MAQVTSGMLAHLVGQIELYIKEVWRYSKGAVDYSEIENTIVACIDVHKMLLCANPSRLFDNGELKAISKEWESIVSLIKQDGYNDPLHQRIAKNIDFTYQLLSELRKSLFNDNFTLSDSSRWASLDEYKEKLAELKIRIGEIKEELEISKENNAVLKEELVALTQKKENVEKKIEQKKEDVKKQEAYEDKITETFKELNGHIEILEKEEQRIQKEYNRCNWILVVLVVLVIVWFGYFLSHATGNVFIFNWYTQLAPWYTPIPFFAAFFWVIIVLRNRANRTLLTIRKDIFKIRYSEGLIKSISRLSDTFENGTKRVTDILDEMVKSYEHQIETSFIEESKKTERDTPVDASDITKAAEVITDFADKIKDIAKSK